MPRLFGQFLIERGLVGERALVDALIEQIASTPTTVECVRDLGLLNDSKILDAMAYQTQHHCEFKQACESLGYWSSEIESKVAERIRKVRIPLGQVLSKRGLMTYEDLAQRFDEFLKLKEDGALKLERPKAAAVELKLVPLAQPVKEGLDLPFEVEFLASEGNVIGDYIELLNDDKKSEVEQGILVWETEAHSNNREKIAESFRNTYREYHTIKGSARFIRAILTEKLIHEAEEILGFCTRHLDKLEASDLERLTSLNLRMCDLVWDLRSSIQNKGSEEAFWGSEDKQRIYKVLYFELGHLRQELEGRNYEIDLEAMKDAF